ncbi:hypothetical protein KKC87_04005 [Patescibacteria group bacterium]|nr:hypothetical protein [Patescibacteria group bacterium]
MEQPNLFIKFKGLNDEPIDLDLFGESVVGFGKLIPEIFKISGIKGEINVKATKLREGSLIVDVLIELFTRLPFDNVQDYLDFLRVVGGTAYHTALNEFSPVLQNAVALERALNDHFARNPLRLLLFAEFVRESIKWIRLQKQRPVVYDDRGYQLPAKFAPKYKKLIKEKKFKKVLRPFVEDKITSIKISSEPDFREASTITPENFGDYLSDDEQILSDFENGQTVRLVGQIVSLQSNRGESMKFKANRIPRKYRLLIAYPPDDKTTEDFIEYYKKEVIVEAEVVRRSLYQKPKIILRSIELHQGELQVD